MLDKLITQIESKAGGILVLLILLYFLQGILYPSGSFVSQTLIALWLLLGIVCYGRVALCRDNLAMVNWLVIFYAIQSITFIVSPKVVNGVDYEAIGEVGTIAQFKEVSAFVLSFMVMYLVARRSGGFDEKGVRYICYAFLLLSVFRFFYVQELLQVEKMQERVTNNVSYFFVGLLPYFPYLLKRNKYLGGVLLSMVIGIVMYSAKRGAIVAMLVMLAFSVIYYAHNIRFTTKNMVAMAGLLCVLIGGICYAYYSNDWLVSRIDRMSVVGMGGRGIAYPLLFNYWCNDGNFWTMMFGNGMSQTVTVWGNYAHNDWLELLINNGVLGVVVYGMIFITAFRFIYRSTLSVESRWAACLCLIVLLVQSVFSMGYAAISNSLYMMLLGLIVGSVKGESCPKKGVRLW